MDVLFNNLAAPLISQKLRCPQLVTVFEMLPSWPLSSHMSKMKRSEPEFRESHLSTPASRLSLVSFPSPGTAYLPSVSNESKIPHTSQLPGLSGLLHTQAKRTWMKPHCLCCVTLNLNRTNGKVTLERTSPLILPCDWWPAIYWPRDLADCFFLQAEPAQCIIKEKTAFFSFYFFFPFLPSSKVNCLNNLLWIFRVP